MMRETQPVVRRVMIMTNPTNASLHPMLDLLTNSAETTKALGIGI
jgi:hypothetical protein